MDFNIEKIRGAIEALKKTAMEGLEDARQRHDQKAEEYCDGLIYAYDRVLELLPTSAAAEMSYKKIGTALGLSENLLCVREPLNYKLLRKLLNGAALSDWTLQEIEKATDWNDALYGDVIYESVVHAAHDGRRALALLSLLTSPTEKEK